VLLEKNLESGPEATLLFWVTRHSCPGDHAARAKTSSLDALASIILLGLGPSPDLLSTRVLVRQSIPWLAHHKHTRKIYLPLNLVFPSVTLVCLWWTRGESNPCLARCSTCFIQQFQYPALLPEKIFANTQHLMACCGSSNRNVISPCSTCTVQPKQFDTHCSIKLSRTRPVLLNVNSVIYCMLKDAAGQNKHYGKTI
jgi:hypothetical protein